MMAGLTTGVVWDEIAAILLVYAQVKHGDFWMAFLLNHIMMDTRTFYFGICEDQMELDWVTTPLTENTWIWRPRSDRLQSGCMLSMTATATTGLASPHPWSQC